MAISAALMNQRRPRLYDRPYLDWLKTRYCIACGKPPPCDPAHIRSKSILYAKPLTGGGRKPDDRWAVPLCRSCHDQQHNHGNEMDWWYRIIKKCPFALAFDYYEQFGGRGGKPKISRTKTKPRRPKEKRQKIPQRKDPWPKSKRVFTPR